MGNFSATVRPVAAPDPIVRRAVADGRDPRAAANELRDAIGDIEPTLVVAFASWRVDPDSAADALAEAFAPAPVIGCTSHGELAAGGDHEGSIAALAIASPRLRVAPALAADLRRSVLRSSRAAVIDAAALLDTTPDALDPRRHVAMTFVDGRSGFEESFCLATAATAPHIRFVGGSASDGYGPEPRTRVFFGGRAHVDAGVVALIESDLPFAVIESEHMVPSQVRSVVTAADPERRRVLELDGFPAPGRYRKLVERLGGGEVDDVVASTFPFATYIGGRPYVRSVVKIDDDALVFAAAVDPGTVLRMMRPGDLVGSTSSALDAAAIEVGGELAAVIAFSCLGRHREALGRGDRAALGAAYDRAPLIGFHSFGEQIGALLVNHTLTGLAFGTGGARG
jgi:hypothetical protein